MSDGTWRAISNGHTYSLVFDGAVTRFVDPPSKVTSRNLDPLFAVAECLRSAGLPPATEIRGPGELTTAEQVEAMRAKCEEVCDGLFNTLDFYDGAPGACDCRDAIKALKP